MSKGIEEKLGIETEKFEKGQELMTVSNNTPMVRFETDESVEIKRAQDRDKARKTYNQIIDDALTASEELLSLAEQSQQAGFYDVYSKLLNTTLSAAKHLEELHKDDKVVSRKEERQNVNVDKAVFVGNSSDFLKQLKDKKE